MLWFAKYMQRGVNKKKSKKQNTIFNKVQTNKDANHQNAKRLYIKTNNETQSD